MGGEWQRVAVSDIAEPVLGGTPAKAKPEYWEGGTIPWATAKDIASTNGRFIYGTEKRITWQGLANSAAKLLPPGTIVITARGTVGAIARLGREMTFNQTCYGLVPRGDDISADYLYYALNATLAEARALTYGTVFETITKKTFDSWNIPLPPLTEQRCIARILGTLDDKIELNRRMNETLEAMAQALFKSWFVDCDPVAVNALKAGNPIPDKFADRAAHYRENLERLGLPEEILRLFPDRFVDSELGPIPEGWEVKAIGELAKCVGGATPSTKNPVYWEGGTNPFLTPKDMAALDAPVVLDTARHITDAGVERISSKRLPAGTVLLSSRAPIGYLAINEVPVSINQGIIAMICDGEIPNYYALFWAKNNMDVIKGKAGGTTFSEISKKNFRTIPALRPSDAILDNFAEITGAFYKQIVENAGSSVTLTNLRDTLLPKLISGELCVPDVEKILEDAL